MAEKRRKETCGTRRANLWREHRKPHMAHELRNLQLMPHARVDLVTQQFICMASVIHMQTISLRCNINFTDLKEDCSAEKQLGPVYQSSEVRYTWVFSPAWVLKSQYLFSVLSIHVGLYIDISDILT
jgi:hypothetical protein